MKLMFILNCLRYKVYDLVLLLIRKIIDDIWIINSKIRMFIKELFIELVGWGLKGYEY